MKAMRLVTPILLILVLMLQYRLWFGRNSVADYAQLKASVANQAQINEKLERRNELLKKEILDLKRGHNAVEERARNELGLIKQGEVFYRLHQSVENQYHD